MSGRGPDPVSDRVPAACRRDLARMGSIGAVLELERWTDVPGCPVRDEWESRWMAASENPGPNGRGPPQTGVQVCPGLADADGPPAAGHAAGHLPAAGHAAGHLPAAGHAAGHAPGSWDGRGERGSRPGDAPAPREPGSAGSVRHARPADVAPEFSAPASAAPGAGAEPSEHRCRGWRHSAYGADPGCPRRRRHRAGDAAGLRLLLRGVPAGAVDLERRPRPGLRVAAGPLGAGPRYPPGPR